MPLRTSAAVAGRIVNVRNHGIAWSLALLGLRQAQQQSMSSPAFCNALCSLRPEGGQLVSSSLPASKSVFPLCIQALLSWMSRQVYFSTVVASRSDQPLYIRIFSSYAFLHIQEQYDIRLCVTIMDEHAHWKFLYPKTLSSFSLARSEALTLLREKYHSITILKIQSSTCCH